MARRTREDIGERTRMQVQRLKQGMHPMNSSKSQGRNSVTRVARSGGETCEESGI